MSKNVALGLLFVSVIALVWGLVISFQVSIKIITATHVLAALAVGWPDLVNYLLICIIAIAFYLVAVLNLGSLDRRSRL